MELFDPTQDVNVAYRRLPHWSQPGVVTFITWRTWDSLPEKVIHQWQEERAAWLVNHGIDPSASDWQSHVSRLGTAMENEFGRILSDRWNKHLDDCHGACVLRRSDLSVIVADSLQHFDGRRYELTDFVVMPNHVHLLAAFPSSNGMLDQCDSWKHFTASQINRILGRTGRFWKQDGFDHLVRSQEQFGYLREYIANNPVKARLRPGEYRCYSSTLA
jgi:REP element-mobilizing transposase RayT